MAVDNPFFTKALLHMDGADASTTFTDESGKVWTAAGNAQIDTAQSKFGGAGGLFDGTGDWLTTPDHADFNLGAGDFTIDMWVRLNSIGATIDLFGQDSGSTDRGYLWRIGGTGTTITFGYSTTGTSLDATLSVNFTFSTNTWYHLAVTRHNSELRFFVDGVQAGATQTISGTIFDAVVTPSIGANRLSTDPNPINGWIDEFHLMKGIALWTQNFTAPTAAYDGAVKSLLHFDGADTSTTFTDETGRVWTARGNAQIDTAQSKFGGESGLFDGTLDWIDTPDHADFDIGSGDFTFDFWVRFSSVPVVSQAAFFAQDDVASDRGYFASFLSVGAGGPAIRFFWTSNGTAGTAPTASWSPVVDTWYHVAYCRSGSTIYFFVDGTLLGTGTMNVTVWNSSQVFSIGANSLGGAPLSGWMDEFRFTKGFARWTASFTVPASAYAAEAVTAAQGSFAYTGQTANLLWAHLLSAVQGAYTYTGQAAGLLVGYVLSAAQGAYTYTGQVAQLIKEVLNSIGSVRLRLTKLGDTIFHSSKTGSSRLHTSKEGDVEGGNN